jgi:Ca-activated chloride channel family protein
VLIVQPSTVALTLVMVYFRFFRSTYFFLLAFFVSAATVFPSAQAQSTDDVHVVPRTYGERSDRKAVSDSGSDPALQAHVKPLRVDVDLVMLSVTVTDPMNRPVINLEKQDFTLYESDKKQVIRYFSTEDAPISVGLILDLSGTMSNKLDIEREAISEFFKNANPQDDYFVITFTDRPQVIADTTQSIGDIQAKLATANPAGYTALLDAVYLGVAKLRKAQYQRRALLIISDGGENASHYKLREIKKLVEEDDIGIYAIGIFDEGMPILRSIEEQFGKHLLTQVTGATGGRTIAVDNAARVPEAAAAISRELRSQYVLGYRTSNSTKDGKWRNIRVLTKKLAGGPRFQTYHRKGYKAGGK